MTPSERNDQLRSFLRLLDSRAPGEAAHAERVAVFATATGQELGLREDELLLLRYAATLHDVGKLAIPPDLLKRHDPLSEGELVGIREHTTAAAWLLEGVEWLTPALPSIRHHHERWDGEGYPDALMGEDIPRGARIIAVAEVFDAVAYDQAYREGLGEEKAIEAVQAGAGRKLDPKVVEAFLRIQPLIQPVIA